MRVSEFDYDAARRAHRPAPRAAAQRQPPAAPAMPRAARSRTWRFADLPQLVDARDTRGAERHARHQGAPCRAQGERRQGRDVRRAHRSAPREALALMRAEPSAGGRAPRSSIGDAVRVRVEGREGELYRVRFAEDVDAGARAPRQRCRCRLTSRMRRDADGRRALPDRLRRASPARWRRRPRACISTRRCSSACARAARRSRKLTLHVGVGTFQPVRVETVEAHRMHASATRIPRRDPAGASPAGACSPSARRRCARWRAPRAAARCDGETDLFIYPGYRIPAWSTACSPTSTCRSRRC